LDKRKNKCSFATSTTKIVESIWRLPAGLSPLLLGLALLFLPLISSWLYYILFLLHLTDRIFGNIMMLFNFIITIFVRIFGIIYKWLDEYLIIYLVNFAKGFEFAIVIVAAIIFLLISLFLTIRYLKQLPNYYIIEIADIYGRKSTVEDLKEYLEVVMLQKVMPAFIVKSIRNSINSE